MQLEPQPAAACTQVLEGAPAQHPPPGSCCRNSSGNASRNSSGNASKNSSSRLQVENANNNSNCLYCGRLALRDRHTPTPLHQQLGIQHHCCTHLLCLAPQVVQHRARSDGKTALDAVKGCAADDQHPGDSQRSNGLQLLSGACVGLVGGRGNSTGVAMTDWPTAEQYGNARTRQCTHTAMHAHGNAHTRQCTHTAMHTHGNAHTRQCTHTAMHTAAAAHAT